MFISLIIPWYRDIFTLEREVMKNRCCLWTLSFMSSKCAQNQGGAFQVLQCGSLLVPAVFPPLSSNAPLPSPLGLAAPEGGIQTCWITVDKFTRWAYAWPWVPGNSARMFTQDHLLKHSGVSICYRKCLMLTFRIWNKNGKKILEIKLSRWFFTYICEDQKNVCST